MKYLLPKLKVKIILVLFLGVLFFSAVLFLPRKADLTSFQTVVASSRLADQFYYQNLNVRPLETYITPSSWGTAVFIPQYHRSTGSDLQDSVNDKGVKSQEQIYKIEQFLADNAGIKLVMTEGSLFGEIPAEKIELLSDKINRRNRLVALCGKLKDAFTKESLNPSLEKNLLNSLEKETAKVDREIILEGAAEKLKAEGKDIKLYGAENKETLNASREILREYIYLSDRMKQSDNASKPKKNVALNNNLQNFLSLMGNGMSKEMKPDFKPLESLALTQEKEGLAKLIKETEDIYYQLDNTPAKVIVSEASDTPSRGNNPYKDETDGKELKEKLSSVKTRMQDVVVERRNRDAAQNFANALKGERQTTGILQYGAGHKEGLVRELNRQGLNVIVVAPE